MSIISRMIEQSREWAECSFRNIGHVRPCFLTYNAEHKRTSQHLFAIGEFNDEQRDRWAEACRLLCIMDNACIGVTTIEGWLGPRTDKDKETRKEAVVIFVETRKTYYAYQAGIVRRSDHAFSGLGKAKKVVRVPKNSKKIAAIGRFMDLIPPCDVPPDLRGHARNSLKNMGMIFDSPPERP